MFKTDTYRLIRKTFKRFFSLIMIVLIGVAFMMGLFSSSAIMRDSVDIYADRDSLHDVQLYSPYGFCDEDIEVLKESEGIEDVFGSKFKDVYCKKPDGDVIVARFEEIDKSIDKIELSEGRLPKYDDEVLILVNLESQKTYELDDHLEIYLEDEEVRDYLPYSRYKIVGFAASPAYMAKTLGTSTLNNEELELVVYCKNRLFKADYYTTVYLTLEGARDTLSFSASYRKFIDEHIVDVENIAAEQQSFHRDNIVNEYQEELDEKKEEFETAKADGQKQLDDAKKQLDDANIKIISTEAEIEVLKNMISTLEGKISTYQEMLSPYYSAEDIESWINDPSAIEQYISGSGYESDVIRDLYRDAADLLSDTRKKLNSAEYQVKKGKAQYEQGMIDYAEALKTFNDEIEKAQAEITKAQQDLDALPDAKWTILDRSSHQSSFMYDANCKQMEAIGYALPFLFFLVAALVCMTTMTRLIDEQRGQIGIFRALGFSRKQVVAKYLVYAFLASIIGSVIGIFVGQMIFPTVIYQTWRLLYDLPPIRLIFPIRFLIICVVSFTGLMMAVTYFVLNKTLKEVPSSLMRPKAPKNAKATFLEKIQLIWERLSFTSKITARNLIRYKSRFFMTVLGVAGCMGLLVVGYGIKDSIADVIELQFSQIFNYEYQIALEDDHHLEDNLKILENDLSNEVIAPFMSYTTRVYFEGDDDTASLLVFNLRDANFVLNLRHTDRKTPLNIDNSGVVVSQKFAINNDIHKGDYITVESVNGVKAQVKVSDICEMYFQHYIFMSERCYEETFDETVHKTMIAIKTDDPASLKRDVRQLTGYESLLDFTSMINQFEVMIDALDLIILVVILTSGALAFVVLFNLTQVNISERIREIATLKVLGFNSHEVNTYIFKEIMILSIIGSFIGIPLGTLEHHFIMNVINMEMVMFGMNIKVLSYSLAFIITIGFTLIVFLFEMKPLREIKMVESLKSVE